jgi:CO/xanthine dehydrogenase Mo-binding subunit
METNAIAVIPEQDGSYTVWVSSQVPFDVRGDLVDVLGVDRKRIRVIAPDVGGGFGAKVPTYPEYLVVAKAAEVLGRPVRWAESRSESMISMTHGRSQVQWIELGARRDGTITGLRFEVLTNVGAYPQLGSFMGQTTAEMISGVYAIGDIAFRGRSVVTNVTPLGAYRGAGRPEAAAAIERAVDLLAGELEMDPAEVRRINMIAPDVFPYRTDSRWTVRWSSPTIRRCALSRLSAGRAATGPRWASGSPRMWRSPGSRRRSSHVSTSNRMGPRARTSGRPRSGKGTRRRSPNWSAASLGCRIPTFVSCIRIPPWSSVDRARGDRGPYRRADRCSSLAPMRSSSVLVA